MQIIKNIQMRQVHAAILLQLALDGPTPLAHLRDWSGETAVLQEHGRLTALSRLVNVGMVVLISYRDDNTFYAITPYGTAGLKDFYKVTTFEELEKMHRKAGNHWDGVMKFPNTGETSAPQFDLSRFTGDAQSLPASRTEPSSGFNVVVTNSDLDYADKLLDDLTERQSTTTLSPAFIQSVSESAEEAPSDTLSQKRQLIKARSIDGIAALDLENCSDTVRTAAAVTRSHHAAKE